MIYLDTNAVLFLVTGRQHEFSDEAKKLLNQSKLMISPMVYLEIEYLHEIKKLNQSAAQIFDYVNRQMNVTLCEFDFRSVAAAAAREKWTRDPFDRIIVAQARSKKRKLLTRDQLIQTHYSGAVW